MATQKRAIDVSLAEVKAALERGLDGADAARAGALEGLARLRAAKAAGLKREQAVLADRYGADDERTVAVTRRAAVNQTLVRQVAAEAQRAAVAVPAPDPEAWILHGRVLDASLGPARGLTVALYDASDVWRKELGHACTDKTGSYRLTARVERSPTTGGRAAAGPAPVFVHVLDARSATLHKDCLLYTSPSPRDTERTR
ncbi:MAG: hypothetical protein IRY94_11080, partial [Rhodospirillaceae bacterium]|nr:hypothetical protein [Rhodospirillaceae bacterium]